MTTATTGALAIGAAQVRRSRAERHLRAVMRAALTGTLDDAAVRQIDDALVEHKLAAGHLEIARTHAGGTR